MIAQEKRRQAEREAKLYGRTSDTAATASTVNSVGEAVLGAGDYAAKRAGQQVAKTAMKSSSRALPVVGNVLDGVDALAGVAADIRRGLSPQDALARNGLRVAPGIAGALVGEAVAGPIGAAVGGLAGGLVKPYLDHVVPPIKEQMKYNFMTFNDPRRWPGRRLP